MDSELNSFDAIKVAEIVHTTTNAYMYDDYGHEEWCKIAVFLLDQGYTTDMVADILLSKHMRWCSDGRGKQTCDEFKYYYGKYKGSIDELFAWTY